MDVVERVGMSSAVSLSFRPAQLMTVGCGVAVSSPQILSLPLPASLKKGGMVMAVFPWYLVARNTLFNVRNSLIVSTTRICVFNLCLVLIVVQVRFVGKIRENLDYFLLKCVSPGAIVLRPCLRFLMVIGSWLCLAMSLPG